MEGQIETDDFGNDDEYILRRHQQSKEHLAVLRLVLLEGESSGNSRPLDAAAIKAAGRKQMKSAE